MGTTPTAFFATVDIGRRIVARYRIPGGFTDALGYLRAKSNSTLLIETRRGEVTVNLSDVVAAKTVPEPPPRRAARGSTESAQEPTE
ncbi:MAG: ferrous iron transport protein A [Nakamurella sp.]